MSDFYNHFKNITAETSSNITDDVEADNQECVYNELDASITQEEVCKILLKLKCNKSPGADNLLNEYFIHFKDILVPLIVQLFNVIFETGYMPKQWCKGILIPVHKKNNVNVTDNYRGITLSSCFCKLFTTIINERLTLWANENDILTDAQFGFRPGHGTTDAIFALQSIITKYLGLKKKLYCCFIDYKSAFDNLNRNFLY